MQISAGISSVAEGGLRHGLTQGIKTAGSLATGTTKRLAKLVLAAAYVFDKTGKRKRRTS